MMKWWSSVCVAGIAAFVLSTPATAQQAAGQPATEQAPAVRDVSMLQLFDGAILWGSIVGHDAQTLHVERLDNGGRLRLPWTQLSPALSEQLLDQYGYVDRSGEEVMVEADRYILRDGREVVAATIRDTFDAFWVKTASSTFAVPKLQIKVPPTRVFVSALEIYTREELYKQELTKLEAVLQDESTSAEDKARAQWDLASYCERIYDFAHAVEHFKALGALAPDFKVNETAAAVARNTTKVALQTQLDALREIDTLRARGRFDDAVRQADAFIASHEDSPLRPDAAKKKTQVLKAREQKMRQRVAEAYVRWLPRLLDQKARTPLLTLEAALSYLDEGLGNDLVDNVTKEVAKTVTAEATPDLVKRYWSERQLGRWRSANYGQGTWLLGESEARKGLEPEEKEAAPTSETDAARKELEERIKRYLQNQEMVRKAQSPDAQGEEEDREKFWAEYSSGSKSQWMLARYAETSGEFQLRAPGFVNCPDCGGTGVRETVSVRGSLNAGNAQGGQRQTGGQISLSKCPTCYHIGVFRKVWYR